MRVPVSWLRDYVELPPDLSSTELASRLTMLGLKLEAIFAAGSDVTGPLVLGRVVEYESENHSNGKTIRWCQVDVGAGEPRGIVCGAANFNAGDLVVVALPGTTLPGGFEITARKTYGHVSDGMICSARELGLGEDHTGIMVLSPAAGSPGDDAAAVLALRDEVIEFEINPDRAYALSLRGVAREAATAYGSTFTDPVEAAEAAAQARTGPGYPVEIADRAGCDVFAALEVTGFDPRATSPGWLARRIQLAGMRPISLAVDVTNYVMLEFGQPIHGYDRDALRGPIVVRRAEPDEGLTTLDGVPRRLATEDLLITDDSGPIGLAGVMGGLSTVLGATTHNIVIEAAHWDPVTIARTARRHKLRSEAAKRFERGTDPTICAAAAHRVAELLVRFGGGEVASGSTLVGKPVPPAPIRMPLQLPEAVAGFGIEQEAVRAALTTVGCRVDSDETGVGGSSGDSLGADAIASGGPVLTVTPPPWRPDLTDPNDLVEEVVRIVGYQNVPSVLPAAPGGRGWTLRQRLTRRIGITLAGAGYVETLSYPFVGDTDWDAMGLEGDDPRRRTLRVSNPLSEQAPLLRTTLLPGLLGALRRNVGRSQPNLGLFEIGSVFLPTTGERPIAPALPVDRAPSLEELKQLAAALPAQPWHVGVVVAGSRSPVGWWGPAVETSWADAVQVCRELGIALGVDVDVAATAHQPWHPGRCAQILVGTTLLGYAGELHPRVCEAYGVPPRTAAAELDLDLLLAHAVAIPVAAAFSTFPVGKEDVALVVDDEVPAAMVAAALWDGAGELLESLRLFDVYRGDQVGPGKKSLAYSLRFRAADRTLTEDEIRQARDAAVRAASTRTGAVQRTA